MAATLSIKTVPQVATAILAALSAAQWTPEGGSAEAAFEAVKRFDSSELIRAFEEILVAQKSRVAFVVMSGESWEEDFATVSRLSARRTLDVTILVSDRVLADRSAAIFGNATHPGCDKLKDLVLEKLCGRLIANPNACDVRPQSAEILFVERLEDTGKSLPGRAAYLIELEVQGGSLSATLGNGPAL